MADFVDVADEVKRLTAVLAGALRVTALDGARSSNHYVPFADATTVTGTTALDVWTPSTGRRFVVRGGYVVAIVHTVLAAATVGTLNLIDSNSGKVVAPLGAFTPLAAVATNITAAAGPLRLDLREGVTGSIVGAKVQIKASVDISTGKISVSGVLWGEEMDR